MRLSLRLRRIASDPVVLLECFVVANMAFLAVDIFVAHSMNGFAHWAEWIPFIFSVVSPILLICAMTAARDVRPPLSSVDAKLTRMQRVSRSIGFAVGLCSIAIGVAGLLWHLNSQFFEEQTLKNLVYAAPFVAPLAYSGIGFLILLNRMVRSDSDEWARWVILLALGGWIGNFALSLADHAQNAYFYWAEWIPVVASSLAVGALTVAIADYRNRIFLRICFGLMTLEIVVGLAGWMLHLIAVAESPMESLWDRVVYSAPVFAPLLFANLAILALIGLAMLYRVAGRGTTPNKVAADSLV
jgi:hypothetical protein